MPETCFVELAIFKEKFHSFSILNFRNEFDDLQTFEDISFPSTDDHSSTKQSHTHSGVIKNKAVVTVH